MDKKIQLTKLHESTNVLTRKTISDLFSKINKFKDNKIVIDFKDIKFISRSCADEYVKQKNMSKKKITELNQSKDIKKMFSIVTKTQEHIEPDIRFENIPRVITV